MRNVHVKDEAYFLNMSFYYGHSY